MMHCVLKLVKVVSSLLEVLVNEKLKLNWVFIRVY